MTTRWRRTRASTTVGHSTDPPRISPRDRRGQGRDAGTGRRPEPRGTEVEGKEEGPPEGRALRPGRIPSEAQAAELDLLVRSNLGFVASIAMDYRDRRVPFDDLLSEGCLGLLEAARRYDPSRGVKFVTYAVWWIRKSMLKAVADHGRLVRIPEYQQRLLKEAREAETVHGAFQPPSAEGRAPSFARLRAMQRPEVSLDQGISNDTETPLGSRLSDLVPSPEEALLRSEAMRLVGLALGVLTAKERRVLGLRYGLAGEQGLSLSETGKLLGLSGERVRQIESGALAKMRRSMVCARRIEAPNRKPRPPAPLSRR